MNADMVVGCLIANFFFTVEVKFDQIRSNISGKQHNSMSITIFLFTELPSSA